MDTINNITNPLPLQSRDPIRKETDPQRKLRAEAESAAEQFETMMAQQLVKSMQSSLDGGNMFGSGTAGDIYNGLAEWELARVLAKSANFGLKEQILRQLPKQEDK